MEKALKKGFVLAVGIVVIMLISGCQQQELPSVRKSRLIAAENMQLKKELEQCSKEIATLKELHDKKLQEQAELLEKCLQEKDAWKEKSRQNVRNQVKGVVDAIMEQNVKLREENKKLKEQIEELKKELGEGKEAEETEEIEN